MMIANPSNDAGSDDGHAHCAGEFLAMDGEETGFIAVSAKTETVENGEFGGGCHDVLTV